MHRSNDEAHRDAALLAIIAEQRQLLENAIHNVDAWRSNAQTLELALSAKGYRIEYRGPNGRPTLVRIRPEDKGGDNAEGR